MRRNVGAEEAVKAAKHYTENVGARMGITKRVIITDGSDYICFEWQAKTAKHTPRIRTVEYEPGWGWIARCPKTGIEIMEEGFRWNSRSVARSVVYEHKILGCGARCAARSKGA